ncbi:DUF305 domain-containing protein [Aquipuribacter sp. SD81]|uniref:DUF305 domain-containing protein n=1 Tax=Aquipuribacter sp. SD81 TaxID=3127703 RepID=UPI00301AEC87
MPGSSRTALYAAVVALLGAGALAGCSAAAEPQALPSDVVHIQPGAPGEPNEVLSEAPVEAEEVFADSPFSEADVAFMRDMQVHHEQALAMTALVADRTDDEQLRLFVQRMDISQTAELEQLERMLAEHDAAVERGGADHGGHSGDHGGDHSGMPGMLSEEQMAAMEAASGDEFVRQFLVGMSAHHEGALAMVEELIATDGAAEDPRLWEFAQHVDSDQRIEIDRMARMYAELPEA